MFPGKNLLACGSLVICLGSVTAFHLVGQDTPDEWPVLKPCAHLLHPQACTDSMLMAHFRSNLNVPSAPEGLMVLGFIVDTFGQITQAEVLHDPLGQGKKLLESLSELPSWVPGSHNGHAMAVPFRIPIRVGGQTETLAGYTLKWGNSHLYPPSRQMLKKKHPERLLVLTPSGDTLSPVQINASWKKGRRKSRITAPPFWDSKSLRWLRRCPRGAQLEFEAVFSQGTRFLTVKNSWIIQP